jgi:hypothetical protein
MLLGNRAYKRKVITMKLGDKKTVMSYEKAERVAEANNKDDPDWAYVVEREHAETFFRPLASIRVHDERGELLGWL